VPEVGLMLVPVHGTSSAHCDVQPCLLSMDPDPRQAQCSLRATPNRARHAPRRTSAPGPQRGTAS
jgi:hypothetical protein